MEMTDENNQYELLRGFKPIMAQFQVGRLVSNVGLNVGNEYGQTKT